MTCRARPLFLVLLGLLSGCVTTGGNERIDNIPMYGQPEIERPAAWKQADEEFIRKAVGGLGSREVASEVWYEEGQRFLRERNLDYAMRRFNQSWLLNPENYQPYWGFARVMVETDRFDEAIKYFEMAEIQCNDPYQKTALLSDFGVAYNWKAKLAPEYFAKANRKFAESVALEPSYPNSWRRWAFSLYDEGDYAGAWKKVKKAQGLNARPLPESFLTALREKAHEPQ